MFDARRDLTALPTSPLSLRERARVRADGGGRCFVPAPHGGTPSPPTPLPQAGEGSADGTSAGRGASFGPTCRRPLDERLTPSPQPCEAAIGPQSQAPSPQSQAPRGITLVELLVVVSILMLLAAFVLPKLELNGDGRKIREAARMTSVFMSAARSRAIETGRPVGVLFEPAENNAGASTILRQVEVPPLYAGDTETAAMMVQGGVDAFGRMMLSGYVSAVDFGAQIASELAVSGGQIRFNYQGSWYLIKGIVPVDANNDGDPEGYTLTLYPPTPVSTSPWPMGVWSAPVPFQILRHPAPTVTPPLILPTGTAVDLFTSGTEREVFETALPVTVLFSPSGAVERLYWTNGTVSREDVPSEPVYFLIGLLSQVPSPTNEPGRVSYEEHPDNPEEDKPNWQLLVSRWAGVNPQTGVVTVAENAATPRWDEEKRNNSSDFRKGVNEARQYVRQSRSMGGGRQ